jgi:SAM-dependent methyltransferase
MTDRNELERSVRACYATWGERYYADYYENAGAYPPVHTGIVRNLLQTSGARSVLDAGCGPASMLRDLELPGLERYGFDLTPEMVREARAVLARQAVPQDRVWEGSVLDAVAFHHPGAAAFDAAVCFGVLPHVPQEADIAVLRNLYDAVRPGGLVAVEARNALFALFTLNRYSREFFRNELIDEKMLRARAGPELAAFDAALQELDERFRIDLPPVRKGYSDEPGYDEVLARTHVPMQLEGQAKELGFIDTRLLFYHYHALPPMLEKNLPQMFRRESVNMEDPTDWRGHVMASAFILVGRRP